MELINITPQEHFYLTKENTLLFKKEDGSVYSIGEDGKLVVQQNNIIANDATRILTFWDLHYEYNESNPVKFLKAPLQFVSDEEGVFWICDRTIEKQYPLNPSWIKNHFHPDLNWVTLLNHSENSVFAKEMLKPLAKFVVLPAAVGTPLVALGIAAWPHVSVWLAVAVWPIMMAIAPYVGIAVAGVISLAFLAFVIKNISVKGIADTIKNAFYFLKLAIHKVRAKLPMAFNYEITLQQNGVIGENLSDSNGKVSKDSYRQWTGELKRRAGFDVIGVKLDEVKKNMESLSKEFCELHMTLDNIKSSDKSKDSPFPDSAADNIRAKMEHINSKMAQLNQKKGRYKEEQDKLSENATELKSSLRTAVQQYLGNKSVPEGAYLKIGATNSNIGPSVDLIMEGETHRLGYVNAKTLSFSSQVEQQPGVQPEPSIEREATPPHGSTASSSVFRVDDQQPSNDGRAPAVPSDEPGIVNRL